MSQNDFVIANQAFPSARTDLSSALQALATLSSGASAPSTTYPGMLWLSTSDHIVYQRNEADSGWVKAWYLGASGWAPYINSVLRDFSENTIADGDTTPGTAGRERLVTANTGATTITDFDGHETGQDVWLRINDNYTTLDHAAGVLELIAGHDVVCQSGDLFHFRDIAGTWKQLPDGIGMGRPGLELITAAALTAPSAGAAPGYQAVDASSVIPKGARAVKLAVVLYATDTAATAAIRKYGAATDHETLLVPVSSQQNFATYDVLVPVDVAAKFEVAFNSAWTTGTNSWKATGYLK